MSVSHNLHLGIWIHGDDIVALWWLDARLCMCLAVQVVLQEEVAFVLEVQAAVVAHEAVGVVEFVSGLHDGSTGQRQRKTPC